MQADYTPASGQKKARAALGRATVGRGSSGLPFQAWPSPEAGQTVAPQQAHQLRTAVPQTRCVILTSHQKFNYVQTALRGGAVDNIVKAATTPDEMLAIFRRIRAQVEQQKHQTKASSLRRRWLARLLVEGWPNIASLRGELELLQLPLRVAPMQVLLVRRDTNRVTVSPADRADVYGVPQPPAG